MNPALVFVRAFAGYPTPQGWLPVVEDFSLEVGEGQWVGVVGPSGCGKTTILRLAAGLLRPARGEVRVEGQDPRGRVAYVPQGDTLLPWRTALGNLTAPLQVEGIPRLQAERRAWELLDRLGLASFARFYPHELSGGMRQRIALSRVFLVDRGMLLLDEPLGALDALTRAELQDWLMHIGPGMHKTAVLVTHDVEEAVLLSDAVVVLTARPARAWTTVPVALSRPRDRLNSQVMERRGRVLAALGEARRA